MTRSILVSTTLSKAPSVRRASRCLALPATILSLGCLACVLTGCEATYGVDVLNKTDHILKVEMMDMHPDGSTVVYSTSTLSKGGKFTNMIQSDQHDNGKRVRFSLSDRPMDDGNWVMMSLPDSKSRVYDLMFINGRLTAHEYLKGRPEERGTD